MRYADDAVDHYLKEAKEVGFDAIEISTRFNHAECLWPTAPSRKSREGRP
ncbi:hypothetical protein [Corynebacterium stationis]|nr:hypothetical protein [Corynebacterium stationis]